MSVAAGLGTDGLAPLVVPCGLTQGGSSRGTQMALWTSLLIDKRQQRGMQRPPASMGDMAEVYSVVAHIQSMQWRSKHKLTESKLK